MPTRSSRRRKSIPALPSADPPKSRSNSRSYKNQDGKSIHLNYSCEGYLGKYELKVRDHFFFCRGGISIGSVWCNGNVGACLSVRAPDLIQGNVYEIHLILQEDMSVQLIA